MRSLPLISFFANSTPPSFAFSSYSYETSSKRPVIGQTSRNLTAKILVATINLATFFEDHKFLEEEASFAFSEISKLFSKDRFFSSLESIEVFIDLVIVALNLKLETDAKTIFNGMFHIDRIKVDTIPLKLFGKIRLLAVRFNDKTLLRQLDDLTISENSL